MDILDLSSFFTTKSEANDFSARLSKISEHIYEVDFNLEDALQKQFGVKKKEKFLTLLRDNEIVLDSNSALSEFFGKIKETINIMPVVTLTLAIEPTSEILKAVADWFLLNLKHQILIEVEINSDLIAGASVNFQGKFYDSSAKSIFDEACAATFTDNEKKTTN